jgi:hypothetical protein
VLYAGLAEGTPRRMICTPRPVFDTVLINFQRQGCASCRADRASLGKLVDVLTIHDYRSEHCQPSPSGLFMKLSS